MGSSSPTLSMMWLLSVAGARGMPRVRSHQDSDKRAKLLERHPTRERDKQRPTGPCHAELPPPKPWKRSKRRNAGDSGAVTEVEVEAELGAWNEESVLEKGRRQLPEGMIRQEGDVHPEALRLIKVRGDSLEPELHAGARVVVDTARRLPVTGEFFVFWDGDGPVVKRIGLAPGDGLAKLRLHCANPVRQSRIRVLRMPCRRRPHRAQGATVTTRELAERMRVILPGGLRMSRWLFFCP